MDQENITFSKNQGKSYTMTDQHILGYNTSFGYEDSYNYYDIDVNKILLLKKRDNEYFIRYNDVNKNEIVPLQLKIENYSFDELDFNSISDTADVIGESNDKEFFIKCREIWNKIIELMDIDNPNDFVIIDDYGDEFIVLDTEKNTSAIRDKHRNDLVFVIASIINTSLQASLVQYCTNKYPY